MDVGANNIVIVVLKTSTQNQEPLEAEPTELSAWPGVVVRKCRTHV